MFERIENQRWDILVKPAEAIILPHEHPMREATDEGVWFKDDEGRKYVLWQVLGSTVYMIGTYFYDNLTMEYLRERLEVFRQWMLGQPLQARSTTPVIERPGLYKKYRVQKIATGELVTDCFVLCPSSDPHALVAILAYAHSCEHENPILAKELGKWVGHPTEFKPSIQNPEVWVGIDWDYRDIDSYRAVYINLGQDDVRFETGDVIADWRAAIEQADTLMPCTVLHALSATDFMFKGMDKYTLTEDGYIVAKE